MGNFPTTLYIENLIDDFGIWQHSDETSILFREGYALDDAARGLVLTLALGNQKQSEVLLSYIINSKAKKGFIGFFGPDRKAIKAIASDDATGQVVWAAGLAYSKGFHVKEAKQLIRHAVDYLNMNRNMRGFTYGLLGAVYLDKKLADSMYLKLKTMFDKTSDDWPWPESKLTYGNGIMPYALLRYGMVFNSDEAINLGMKLLAFIEGRCTNNRKRGPIGNDGWLPKNKGSAPAYSQQPIDAAYMVWAWLAAYKISKNPSHLEKSRAWFNWFEGDNIAGEKMYDPADMRCYDGIDPGGVHRNSGAESNICLLLSKYMLFDEKVI